MQETFRGKIRKSAEELGRFTVKELSEAVPIQSYDGMKKLRVEINKLKERGEVETIKSGLYQYVGVQKRLTKFEKMWRAMRIKGCFSRQDIVRLTGASRSHAKRCFINLKREGLIVHVSGRGYSNRIYRIANPEQAPLEYPKMKR